MKTRKHCEASCIAHLTKQRRRPRLALIERAAQQCTRLTQPGRQAKSSDATALRTILC